MPCDCPRRGLRAPPPARVGIRVREKDTAIKAHTLVPGPLVVVVNRAWWRGLRDVERTVVLAHEASHHEAGCANGVDGAEDCPLWPDACEACADRRAGAICRAWGLSRTAVARAFTTIVASRNGALDAIEGWEAYR